MSEGTVENFTEAAAWPDDISDNKLKFIQNWHFENIKITADENGKITSKLDSELPYIFNKNEAIDAYV
jgi:hypothetical protein